MAEYLADSSIFAEDTRQWPEIAELLRTGLEAAGFPMGKGLVYNYGIWKAKKGKFRFIAETR